MGCSPHARFNESSPDAAGRIWAANSAFARAGIEHRLTAAVDGLMDVGRWMLVPGWRFQTETKGFPSSGKEHPSRSQTSRGVTIIMNIIHELRVDRTGAPQPNAGIAFAHIHRQFRKQHDPGELQLHCAGDTVRWPFKITGLTKFLGVLLILAALSTTVQAGQSVTLAWNRSTDPIVAGYKIYYGGTSGTYTNMVNAGNATNATISGLVQGRTYYFAATTYSSLGVESSFSSEASYTVPILAGVQLLITPTRQFILTVTGPVGHTYDILATQDFKTWTVIGTRTVGTNGSLNFTDTNAPSFSKRFYRTRG
jgi:hypothetical protein